MVDPTKGIGPLQGLISGTRVTDASTARRTPETKESTPKDEVTLSTKALNVSQAEDVSTKIRDALQADKSLSLGKGGGFDESL